jgi:RNA polymerase sigma factor (sigma-70 family)
MTALALTRSSWERALLYSRAAPSVATVPPVATDARTNLLFAEFTPYVRSLIRRLTDDAEMRKDLHGEAWLVFRSLVERYDPARGIPLRPYLVCQLRSHLFSQCRSRRGIMRRETCISAVESPSRAQADPTTEWDRQIELRRLASALPEMLSHVPLRQRRVILWRYFDGMTFEEIAERLRVQPATARSLLRHGLNRLRALAAERDCLIDAA